VTISLIAAVAAHGVIGNRGALPWRLPDDMARFRELTMGHAVIMGRATFASLRKPLRGRRNIVLSRDAGLRIEGCAVVHSRAEAQEAASGDDEAFVIGGASIYELFLPGAHRLYITWIDVAVPGDTVFPTVDWREWRVTREAAGQPKAPLPYRFVDYERVPGYTQHDAG
jgi:dihydrofolate reductase